MNPYLALDAIHELIEEMLDKDLLCGSGGLYTGDPAWNREDFIKMGISTIQSYQGAKIFEAIGISKEVTDKYFAGTVSRVGGITMEDIEKQVDEYHTKAFDPLGLTTNLALESMGKHKRRADGEEHRYNPETIHLLQQATWTGNYELFKEYTKKIDAEETGYLRSLMDFAYAEKEIPLDEVESVEDIVKRFKTGAMSYGSISQEAHETLAIAMNHLHGKSNSGEGGESDERLDSANTETDRCSAIKQVASGRFGVTSRYLVSAKKSRLNWQEAKPGEREFREKGVSVGGKDKTFHTGSESDFSAAASRHLFDRRSGTVDL